MYRRVLLLVVVTLLGVASARLPLRPLASALAAPTQTATVVPFSTSSLPVQYLALINQPPGNGPAGWQTATFDDSSWQLAPAPFGTLTYDEGGYGCTGQDPLTAWTGLNDIFLRKVINLPAGTTGVTVTAAFDDEIQVFLNGTEITSGMTAQGGNGCANQNRHTFTAPDNVLLSGANTLAIHARNLQGIQSVDVQVQATEPAVTGTVTGTVRSGSSSGPAVAGAKVYACPTTSTDCPDSTASATDATGTYTLTRPAGTYKVQVYPPTASTLATASAVVSVTVGATTTQDLVLPVPTPLPSGNVSWLAGGRLNDSAGGVPTLFWTTSFTVCLPTCNFLNSTPDCTGGTATYTLFDDEGNQLRTGFMTRSSGAPGFYVVTIDPTAPYHGSMRVTLHLTCPSGPSPADMTGSVYIDPSGSVTTPGGVPLAGVTVTLLHSDTANGSFTAVPDGDATMSPANRKNPDLTDTTGQFGWDVLPGFYEVQASKAGCTPTAQSTSAVLTIPPPVTNLVLTLNCPGGDVNGDGSTTSLDALCVLRSVAVLNGTEKCPALPLTAPSVGDVNNDGSVTSLDALCVLRSVALLPATEKCPSLAASSTPPPARTSGR